MTSYPRKSKLFQAWSKAMVAGATVDKPDYSSKKKPNTTRGGKSNARRRRRRKRKNAKKD